MTTGARRALGALLLVGAALLLGYGVVTASGGGSGGRSPGGSAPRPPTALARFDLPRGWEDRTRDLAGDVPGGPADFVFLGPASNGFRSNLNVVRQPRGQETPQLDGLVALVAERVRAELSAETVGTPRRLTLGGVPAVAYDYRYRTRDHPLQGRQIVTVHGDTVVFVNFTAHQRAFQRHARALDVLTGSWRWG